MRFTTVSDAEKKAEAWGARQSHGAIRTCLFQNRSTFFVSFEKISTGHCGADLNVSAQTVLLKEQMYLQETH